MAARTPGPATLASSNGRAASVGLAQAAARRLPVGAEVLPGGGVHFRVWAPGCRRVEVAFTGGGRGGGGRPADFALQPEPASGGYFSGVAAEAAPGDLYRYRLDGGEGFPDPASRYQPEGPHGPSRVVDPGAFAWKDAAWRGATLPGQVIYELHVGTFTHEGTWAAAAHHLAELAELGVTLLEVMPVAEFPGRFGWGYDGVNLFAPTRLYGEPDDFRRFVDQAHGLGLGVLLDVVYNHLGPDGNFLGMFSPAYFTELHRNDWGGAVHFYGAPAVRELFIANAAYWIDEYHLDGLRLDATQDIHDRPRRPSEHILAAVGRAAREAAAALPPGRSVVLVAENEPQDGRLVRPCERGGYGLDALWSDDFHHSARVALTGRAEAYYSDYQGSPRELLAAAKFGVLYQGQRYLWQGQRRGAPAFDLPRRAFVFFLENHDQIANAARGERLHRLASPEQYRALTALLLLGPATPMLFQGQELGAATPFLYFADHHPELAAAVRRGRNRFLSQFPSLAAPQVLAAIPDPAAPSTFERSKLDRAAAHPTKDHGGGAPGDGEATRQAAALALHRDLLRLRRDDPVIRLQGAGGFDGAVLGEGALVLRWFAPAEPGAGDRLLVINLGVDLVLAPAPEPLLAPPAGGRWQVLWSSEDRRYGGSGAAPPEDEGGGWRLPGHAAVLLQPVAREGGGFTRGNDTHGEATHSKDTHSKDTPGDERQGG